MITPTAKFTNWAGDPVECYGEWRWDSNALVVGDGADGEEFEEFWCEGAESWDEAFKILNAWGERTGVRILELTAC